jgi:hypothetical protein
MKEFIYYSTTCLRGLEIYKICQTLTQLTTVWKNEKYVDTAMKMEVTSSSEAMVSTYQVIWRQVPESLIVVFTAVRTSNLIWNVDHQFICQYSNKVAK